MRYLKLNGKNDLVTLCTMIIFASSVKHAAVNFLQWEYGCFAPICPSTMRGKIPNESDRGKITTEWLMNSLPDEEICTRFAAASSVLSEFSEDEVFLLTEEKEIGKSNNLSEMALNSPVTSIRRGILPPRWLFTEKDAIEAHAKFRRGLRAIEEKIKTRNNGLSYPFEPYEVLLPSRIPCSIAI